MSALLGLDYFKAFQGAPRTASAVTQVMLILVAVPARWTAVPLFLENTPQSSLTKNRQKHSFQPHTTLPRIPETPAA